jgi:hypothetical protein
MAVTKNHHSALLGKAFQKPAATLSQFSAQRTRQGPIAQRRLWRGQFVQYVDFHAAQLPRDGGRKPQRRRIHIATHGFDWGNGTKLVEHGIGPYVAGMQDFVYTLQQRREIGIEISVRVGDYADPYY